MADGTFEEGCHRAPPYLVQTALRQCL